MNGLKNDPSPDQLKVTKKAEGIMLSFPLPVYLKREYDVELLGTKWGSSFEVPADTQQVNTNLALMLTEDGIYPFAGDYAVKVTLHHGNRRIELGPVDLPLTTEDILRYKLVNNPELNPENATKESQMKKTPTADSTVAPDSVVIPAVEPIKGSIEPIVPTPQAPITTVPPGITNPPIKPANGNGERKHPSLTPTLPNPVADKWPGHESEASARPAKPEANVPAPMIKIEGLHLTVRVPDIAEKVGIVGKDNNGAEVFPYTEHEVKGQVYVGGHVKTLPRDKNVQLKPGEMTFMARTVTTDSAVSEFTACKVNLTANMIGEIERKPTSQPDEQSEVATTYGETDMDRFNRRLDKLFARDAAVLTEVKATRSEVASLKEQLAGVDTKLVAMKTGLETVGGSNSGNVPEATLENLRKQVESLESTARKLASLANSNNPSKDDVASAKEQVAALKAVLDEVESRIKSELGNLITKGFEGLSSQIKDGVKAIQELGKVVVTGFGKAEAVAGDRHTEVLGAIRGIKGGGKSGDAIAPAPLPPRVTVPVYEQKWFWAFVLGIIAMVALVGLFLHWSHAIHQPWAPAPAPALITPPPPKTDSGTGGSGGQASAPRTVWTERAIPTVDTTPRTGAIASAPEKAPATTTSGLTINVGTVHLAVAVAASDPAPQQTLVAYVERPPTVWPGSDLHRSPPVQVVQVSQPQPQTVVVANQYPYQQQVYGPAYGYGYSGYGIPVSFGLGMIVGNALTRSHRDYLIQEYGHGRPNVGRPGPQSHGPQFPFNGGGQNHPRPPGRGRM